MISFSIPEYDVLIAVKNQDFRVFFKNNIQKFRLVKHK